MSNNEKMTADQATAHPETNNVEPKFKLYRRRWVVLALFALLCLANSIQWVQYTIIADVIMEYYDVPASAVNWTSMVWMVVYVVLILPATWLYNKFGLRFAIIVGASLNCLAAWIKVLSVDPNLFWVTMIGQTVVASAQVYVLSTPSAVAATWFGPEEVSTACSIGVFGLHTGNTLGFLIPPLMVKNGTTEEIGHDLSVMFYTVAIITTVLWIFTIIFVKAAPPTPPSAAQAQRTGMEDETPREFLAGIVRVMRQRNFVLLFFAYAANMAVLSAILTYINPMVLEQYEDGQQAAGNIGVTTMASGVAGTVIIGYFLDRTRYYKETCLALFIAAAVSLVAYTLLLEYSSLLTLYFAAALIGFFLIGYLPAGYEFGAELTYPEKESMTSCVLALGTQFFAFLLTWTYGAIIEAYTAFASNWLMVGVQALGIVLSALTHSDLRRQRAEKDRNV